MTTILMDQMMTESNIKVKNIKELYYYVINSVEFTEMWILNKNDLSNNEKNALVNSQKSTNRINI
jgi:hypothetical protein